jgi:hypothetical protein
MRFPSFITLIIVGGVAFASPSRSQEIPAANPAPTLEAIIERIAQSESALIARMRTFHPVVEVYVQNVLPDQQLGSVPVHDDYFLGQFEWSEKDGPKVRPLTPSTGTFRQASVWRSHPFALQYLPDGFAAMAVPDWRTLNRSRYAFTYVKREFLGEARCLVLDVTPKDKRDGFSGRIWVEDRDYNVVRFNGISLNLDHTLASAFRKKVSFHVDSWRVNVAPGLWLPAYVYSDEDLSDNPKLARTARIKSQVRFWGYESKGTQKQQQFTDILIDEPSVRDTTDRGQQMSPILSQRKWEQEAEDNVLDRLEKSALLAPPGDVDKVLETVVNNLAVTNNLAVDAPVHCRVLLTSPLESFTVGHTIVLSRGLIDVLPDEASLAMMLAHELSHIVLGHKLIDTKFAFADRLMIPDGELLGTVRFRHDAREEAAADAKVIELLKNSPYKDKLSNAGLFLRAIDGFAKQLPNLIQPHIGEQIAGGGQAVRLGELMQQAPELAPERLDQVAALPLGARLVVDPWSGQVTLLRTQEVPIVSAHEKVALAVTPLVPYIKYAESLARASSAPETK